MNLTSRSAFLISLLCGSLLFTPISAVAASQAPEAIWDVKVEADEDGIRVIVLNDDNDGTGIPTVLYTLDLNNYIPVPSDYMVYQGGGFWQDFFKLYWSVKCGTQGQIVVTDGALSTAVVPFTVACVGRVGTIRGNAFRDGARFGGAWYKITDGGNWYVCGTVGPDGTYGVPVRPGVYYVIPLNLQGLRASGVMRVVVEGGKASLNNDIRYESDPTATHESCDLYNPPRPVPSEVRR